MNRNQALKALACAGALFASSVSAEIIVREGDAASAQSAYAFAHPAMSSVVFVSPEARQQAILPPSVVFIQPPPLLMRAPSPFPAYPPASPSSGLNRPTGPSNRDVTTYHLQRAHGFSQELFYRDTYLTLGATQGPIYFWNGSTMPAYPPVAHGSSRPSNRDNATYNLERAHRFSMDAYRKP